MVHGTIAFSPWHTVCVGSRSGYVGERWSHHRYNSIAGRKALQVQTRALSWGVVECCGLLLLLAGGCNEIPGVPWNPGAGHGQDKDEPTAPTETVDETPSQADVEKLGKLIFEDKRLSASGKQACASCHAAEQAFTGNDNPSDPLFPVATGADGVQLGDRNPPTVMYMAFSPQFGFEVTGTRTTPTGGQFWDGRADTLAEQALLPFLNPREMAMPSKGAVIAKIKYGPYAKLFRKVYGPDAFEDVDAAYAHVGEAIEAFEMTPRFAPFSSKLDAVLDGTTELDAHEANGLALFKDSTKGNCAFCHKITPDSKLHENWLFTSFTHRNIGVPRNPEIPDNDDCNHFDLGLCSQPNITAKVPASVTDAAAFVKTLCGSFKVPTLRNVAKTAPYMHNGVFKTLREAVAFYATRETHPELWYTLDEHGAPVKYDDLPVEHRGNVSSTRAPFDRLPGQAPRLSESEIDDVVAFLNALSDGYQPAATN